MHRDNGEVSPPFKNPSSYVLMIQDAEDRRQEEAGQEGDAADHQEDGGGGNSTQYTGHQTPRGDWERYTPYGSEWPSYFMQMAHGGCSLLSSQRPHVGPALLTLMMMDARVRSHMVVRFLFFLCIWRHRVFF